MAWPCISRVCCLARFWNQFDKSDLSVPLTIQNYSDIGEQEIRSVAGRLPAEREHRAVQATPERRRYSPSTATSITAAQNGAAPASRRCTEQSYPPQRDAPFPGLTQYKQDYKPWPIPKKDYPWINNSGGRSSPGNGALRRTGKEERGSRQPAEPTAKTSSYRQEYKPWAGVQPSKPAQKRPTCLSTGTSEPPPETSYQAAFSVDTHRNADFSVPDISPHAPLSSLERADRVEVSSRSEEQVAKTKLSPNPSAVFQGGSGIFNI